MGFLFATLHFSHTHIHTYIHTYLHTYLHTYTLHIRKFKFFLFGEFVCLFVFLRKKKRVVGLDWRSGGGDEVCVCVCVCVCVQGGVLLR